MTMIDKVPAGYDLIGIDGNYELYADKQRQNGVVKNTYDDTVSDVQPVQLFLKWYMFEEPPKP